MNAELEIRLFILTTIGHTHRDQFQIAYSDYNDQTFQSAIEMSYICPSMTPTSGPPAFRVYTVDPVTFGVLDSTTYIANISSPTFQTTGPVWEKYYSAKEAYGSLLDPPLTDPAAELTPAFWHNVTALFETDDSVFQDYEARQTRGFEVTPCTGSCKTSQICQLRAARSENNCATVTPGVSFSKRGEVWERGLGIVEADICEGSLMRPIMTKIMAKQGLIEEVHQRVMGKKKM